MEVDSSGSCRCIADGYAQPDSIPFPRLHMTAPRDVPRRHMPLLDSTPRIDYCLLLLLSSIINHLSESIDICTLARRNHL